MNKPLSLSEARQLKRVIKSNPTLTAEELERSLRWITAGITSLRRGTNHETNN
jgi:hypothetical protein